jgi:hypothetical protein
LLALLINFFFRWACFGSFSFILVCWCFLSYIFFWLNVVVVVVVVVDVDVVVKISNRIEESSFSCLSVFKKNEKDEVSWIEWKKALSDALVESKHLYTVTEKVTKIYGAGAADVKRITVQD